VNLSSEKKSKDLLEYIQYMSIFSCNSIETFDFSSLYTTITHSKQIERISPTALPKKEWPT